MEGFGLQEFLGWRGKKDQLRAVFSREYISSQTGQPVIDEFPLSEGGLEEVLRTVTHIDAETGQVRTETASTDTDKNLVRYAQEHPKESYVGPEGHSFRLVA